MWLRQFSQAKRSIDVTSLSFKTGVFINFVSIFHTHQPLPLHPPWRVEQEFKNVNKTKSNKLL